MIINHRLKFISFKLGNLAFFTYYIIDFKENHKVPQLSFFKKIDWKMEITFFSKHHFFFTLTNRQKSNNSVK